MANPIIKAINHYTATDGTNTEKWLATVVHEADILSADGTRSKQIFYLEVDPSALQVFMETAERAFKAGATKGFANDAKYHSPPN